MKKVLCLVLTIALLVSSFAFQTAFAEDDIKVLVNGKSLTMDQPPVLVNDRTLVPVRAIFEALGAKVDWNNDTNTATGVLGGTTVEIQIENTVAKVNGKDVTLDVPAKLISDRTLVPVRFISESLGAKVDWNNDTQTVIITTEENAKVITFDDVSALTAEKDFQVGGGASKGSVLLTDRKDHTTGSGKSVVMSNRKATAHRVKFMNDYAASKDIGDSYTVSAYVMVDTDSKVRMGTYSVTGGKNATAALESVETDAKANEWTLIEKTFKYDSDAALIGFDQSPGTTLSENLYIDDITIKSGGKTSEPEKTQGSLLNDDGSRKIPDTFKKSSDLNDLIYYESDVTGKTPEQFLAELPEGDRVIGFSDLENAAIMGGNFGTVEKVALTDDTYKEAYRIDVKELPEYAYKFQLQIKIPDNTFEIGDVVLCRLTMRTVAGGVPESKMGQVQYNIENFKTNGSPKVLIGDTIAGSEWVTSYAATQIDKGFLENIQTDVRLGYYVQTVEIADYEIINYKNKIKLSDVPSTTGYPGQEKDAEWRKEALERIEKIRKGDVKVIVKDANGNVIPDAKVDVNMYEHTFKWGTAVNGTIYNSSEKGENYRKNLVKYFNSAVLENNHKWKALDENKEAAWKDVKWLNDNGLSVRGHTLVWPSYNSDYAVPQYVRDAVSAKDKAKFDEYIKNHIQNPLKDWKGALTDWDLTNELVNNKNFVDAFGKTIYLDWLKWANEADPDTPMYLSETAIIGTDDNTLNKYIDILKYLNENNAPYDGMAIHAHMANLVEPMKFYNQLMKIIETSPDKKMQITEFDVRARDAYAGAEFIRDIIILCYSIEQMEGFYCWGFYDGSHWFNNAPLFDKDWNLKPSGEQFEDLVYNKFMTRESGTSDANGEYSLRAFYGLYNVTASANGKTKTVKTEIKKGADNTIVVTLD